MGVFPYFFKYCSDTQVQVLLNVYSLEHVAAFHKLKGLRTSPRAEMESKSDHKMIRYIQYMEHV